MSELKFTPGPWLLRKLPAGAGAMARTFVLDAIPDRDGKVVANVIAFPTTNPDWEANAAIISAAPTMYQFIFRLATEGNSDAAKIIASIG
jgi:hypothetical protein